MDVAAKASVLGSAAPRDRARTGRSTVATSMLALAFGPSAVLIMCFGVFLPALHDSFGWPPSRIALGGSIVSLAIMLLSPLQGWLTDRFGSRRIVLTFLPLWALGLAAMAALPGDIRLFYLACFVLPFTGLGIWPLSFMKLVSGWFDRHLGVALGLTNVGLSLGSVGLPILLGAIFAHAGWRVAYLVLAAIVLLLVLPMAVLGLDEAAGTRTGSSAALDRIAFREALATRAFWIMVIVFPLIGAVSTGLLVHQTSILIAGGVSAGRAITLQAATGIGSTVARIGTGWLLDRLPVRVVGIVLMLIAAAACLLLASRSVAHVAIPAACLVGIVVGAEFDVLGILIRRYHGLAAFGRIYGIVFAVFQLGAAVGAAAIALTRSETGRYGPALIVLAVACLAGSTLFPALGAPRFLPAPRGDRSAEA